MGGTVDDRCKVSGSGRRAEWMRAAGAVVSVAAVVLLGAGAVTVGGAVTGGTGALAAVPSACSSLATCGRFTQGVRWQ